MREALAALEILGIVDVRPGSGTYLRGTASELLPQSLSWGVLIGERNTAELLELRSGLEIYVARLAADRLTEAQLACPAAPRRHARVRRRACSFVKADLAFHLELATSVDNSVLLDLLQIVRSLLRIWVDRAVQDEGHAQTALDEHEAVYRALAARDGDAAASAMATHMATASARLASMRVDSEPPGPPAPPDPTARIVRPRPPRVDRVLLAPPVLGHEAQAVARLVDRDQGLELPEVPPRQARPGSGGP